MKRHIPNTITLCNLICGCIAVRYAFADSYMSALLFVVLGAVFDFFDGFAARKLGVSSPIGKELDSLADVITFGFAPSAMVCSLLSGYIYTYAADAGFAASESCIRHLGLVAFLIAAFSALRLAKFNLDERQASSFIGLPTPANALLLGSIVITLDSHTDWLGTMGGQSVSPYLVGMVLLCVLSVVSSILLVCELPLFALKFKHFGWRGNEVRYVFLLSSALLLAIMALCSLSHLIAGIGVVIVWYVILSLFAARKA